MKQHLLTVLASLCFGFALSQPSSGLVTYWQLNGNYTSTGTTVITGTNFGSTATTNAAGAANTAVNFNNPTSTPAQYATHPVAAGINYNGTQDFTIDISFYVAAPFAHTTGLYDNNLNYGGYGFWIWNAPGYLQLNFNYKNGNIGTTNGALTTNTWYRATFVRSAGAIKIYINGVLNASGTEGTFAPVYNFDGRFGSMFFNTGVPKEYNPMNGKMDEMRVYNRALTAGEIAGWGVLPIKLSNFIAAKSNRDVLLQWQTEYEQNSDHYTIQQSTDGINFTDIGKVLAKGTSSVLSSYQFTDNTVNTLTAVKTVYYRLVTVDKDGRTQNSGIISVRMDAGQQDGLRVLQNPVTDQLNLQVSSPVKETGTIIITDIAGRQFISKSISINTNDVFTVIPVNMLAAGNYYVTLLSASGKQTISFLRQ